MSKRRVNSKAKGKACELEGAHYLASLRFEDARRTAQVRGNDGAADIECPKSLPGVWIECKVHADIDIGSCKFIDAVNQCVRDCPNSKRWCILWRRSARGKSVAWRLSLYDPDWGVMTLHQDETIHDALLTLNEWASTAGKE